MVSYKKLWDRMEAMGLSKMDLSHIISAPTISKLKKNQYIKLSTVENICKFLQCTPSDIMEFDDDMTHASWRQDASNRFVGKKIIPAAQLIEEEAED